jgi:hypothetical protein
MRKVGRSENEGQEGRRGGGKLIRSETVTVRLDAKLRYLAELAARKQRRTVSSFIEWTIEETLKSIYLSDYEGDDAVSLAQEANELWDVDEPDRLVKLALRRPAMLTHEEQIIWKLIKENGFFWRGNYNTGEWAWKIQESSFKFERLREHWVTFRAVARGEIDKIMLPKWAKQKPTATGESRPDLDDEIPY